MSTLLEPPSSHRLNAPIIHKCHHNGPHILVSQVDLQANSIHNKARIENMHQVAKMTNHLIILVKLCITW
jgi:hypothetical protein